MTIDYKPFSASMLADMAVLVSLMKEKGFPTPHARYEVGTDDNRVFLRYAKPGGGYYDTVYKMFDVGPCGVNSAIEDARHWIEGQPSKDEKALSDYLGIIAKAVEFAKDNNLEQPFINPLQELAAKLAKNILPRNGANHGA